MRVGASACRVAVPDVLHCRCLEDVRHGCDLGCGAREEEDCCGSCPCDCDVSGFQVLRHDGGVIWLRLLCNGSCGIALPMGSCLEMGFERM